MSSGPHGHPVGYQRGCEQCKASRRKRARHGSASKYREGCRCPSCTKAHSAAQQRLRATSPKARSRIVALPSTAQPSRIGRGAGEVEQAVRAQLENNPKAQDRPGEAAAAIKPAQLMDSPEYAAISDRLAAKLHVLLLSMRGTKKSRGRLASIESLRASRITTERKAAGSE